VAEVDKTWVVTSDKPRPSHEAIDGETVPYGDPFSNGLYYPGDPTGSADETAGCTCLMLVDGEVAPPEAPPEAPAGGPIEYPDIEVPFPEDRQLSPLGETLYSNLVGKLTAEPTAAEASAVESYSVSDFSYVNEYLRAGGDPAALGAGDLVRGVADGLDSLVARNPLPGDVVLHRGGVAIRTGLDRGTVITDQGFMSTSIDRGMAADFVSEYAQDPALYDITVPAGTGVALGLDTEGEVILGRGTTLVVDEFGTAQLVIGQESQQEIRYLQVIKAHVVDASAAAPDAAGVLAANAATAEFQSAARFATSSMPELTDVEAAALKAYENTDVSTDVNAYLRSGSADVLETIDAAQVGDVVGGLDSALARSWLDQPLVVFRGGPGVAGLGPTADPAYLSTSLDPGVAAKFAGGTSDNPAVWEISLPAGTSAMGGVGQEAELILPRGTPLEVTGVDTVRIDVSELRDEFGHLVVPDAKYVDVQLVHAVPAGPAPSAAVPSWMSPLLDDALQSTATEGKAIGTGINAPHWGTVAQADGSKLDVVLKVVPSEEQAAELAAQSFNEDYGFNVLLPRTSENPDFTLVSAKVPGKTGLEIYEARSTGGAQAALEDAVSRIPLQERQSMVLFDQVIGNLDRNDGNWLITADHHLVALDHGLAFTQTGSLTFPGGGALYDSAIRESLSGDMVLTDAQRTILDTMVEDEASIRQQWDGFVDVDAMFERIDHILTTGQWRT
jgi:hypothetical protein